MLAELSLPVILWCCFALACGGVIKGSLGVGTPLLTVPLMALVLPAKVAVAMMAIPVVVANLWQYYQAADYVAVARRFWVAFGAILVGTYIGVGILSAIDERGLLLLVGVMVIAFTLFQASSYRLSIPAVMEKPAGAGFGMASGVIGGVSSMFGPMLILYLVSLRGLDKHQFVSAISFLYVGAVVPWTAILVWFGILDGPLLGLSAAAVIPVTAGLVIGQKLRTRIGEQVFRRLVLVVLLASGGTMLWRGMMVGG